MPPETMDSIRETVTKTSCRFCAARCGIHLYWVEGRMVKIDGDPDHPVSRGWTCARGRAATARQVIRETGPVTPRL